MGLFDQVRCARPLPDGKPAVVFQTKTFPDPYMADFVIREDGRLIRKPRWWIEGDAETDMGFHGWLNFYNYDTDTKVMRDFLAKFTDGQLVEIVPVEDI